MINDNWAVEGDLDNVGNCPMGQSCETCGVTVDLNLETAESMMGVFCMTLCDGCTEYGRMPRYSAPEAVDKVLTHCGHIGISADKMAALLSQRK